MSLTDRQREIIEVAKEHGDRYLLPRRVKKPHSFDKATETDLRYDDCDALVNAGYAQWLDWSSNFAPGIRLTGKPF